MTDPSSIRFRRTAGVAVGAGCLVLLWLTIFRGTVPAWLFFSGDSALWIDEAKRVVAGEVLYRDFFDFIGPGIIYWNALLLRTLGATPAALCGGVILAGGAIALIIAQLTRRLSTLRAAAIAPFIFIALVYVNYSPGNHKWLALGFLLGGALTMTREQQTAWTMGCGGALFGAAILCTQDLAGGATAGVLATLIYDARKGRIQSSRLVAFAGGGCLLIMACMSYFVAVAGFKTVFYDTVIFPLTRYHSVNNPFGAGEIMVQLDFYRGFAKALRSIGHLAFIACSIALAWHGLRRDQRPLARVLAAMSVGMIVAGLPNRGLYPPLLALQITPLIPAFTDWALRKSGPRRLAAVLVAISCVTSAAARIVRVQTLPIEREYRAGRVALQRSMTGVDWIERKVPRHGYTFAFPTEGGTYFLSDTRNATSFSFLEDAGFSPPAQIEKALNEIHRNRPVAGVFDDYGLVTLNPRTSTLKPLYDELMRIYPVIRRTNDRFTLFAVRE